MVNVRLDTLPRDQPWSVVGWRFVCKVCGLAGSVMQVLAAKVPAPAVWLLGPFGSGPRNHFPHRRNIPETNPA